VKVREVQDKIEQKLLGWWDRSEKELEKLRNEREWRERLDESRQGFQTN
jgi:hypothetical protein